ncbi:DNA polymerase III subunit gamma/tau [Crenothrix polyspora]|uniref:DNA polymerase III subunit gamma/tau n=1 Tax=Crenothrix polyspora TaxID=360316 RepID=A0A1R4HD31_9GAMM|nr:DNA polymerase III subunit gamma/tau [Crenothrix polyspora]SJM94134.1 DNA polymerase III/DNA elongation factor III, tau and gamma subunits [Crenothrix polyspora]
MNYQVLARKWRPHNFSEVVGQSHVVKALMNALQHNRLHHAYLFTGTRGVGKTTLARILAKAINCENLQDFNPCGDCPICREVDEGRFLDLIEVDAASRTKVEDTRDLLDNVQYAPNRGRYKVYLIDEVHMLSGHSFNALLKTLEEPPAHVKFLLATTDSQKIPVTVLSRCLQFNLKQLLPSQIFGQMTYILEQEGIASDTSALKLLARAADGSMRDGLSLLDQAIVFGNGSVRADDVRDMLGTIAQQPVEDILTALAAGDANAILATISSITDLSPDFGDVLAQILQVLHRTALLQVVPTAIDQDFDAEMLNTLATQFTPEDVQLYYQIALMGQKDLDLAPDPRSGFEMVMLRMLAFRPVKIESVVRVGAASVPAKPAPAAVQQAPVNTMARPAPPLVSVSLPITPPSISVYAPQPELSTQIQEPPVTLLQSAPVQLSDNWPDMIAAMRLSGLSRELANNCILESIDDTLCTLLIDPGSASIRSARTEESLLKALQAYRGSQIKLVITAQKTTTDTPAIQNIKDRESRQQTAVDAINTDDNIQALKKHFGAQVIPGTVEPR